MKSVGIFFLFFFGVMGLCAQTTPINDRDGSPMRLKWFSEQAPDAVSKYEHVELGMMLPPNVEASIRNYLNGIPTSRALNPFDPQDIEVVAYFKKENALPKALPEKRFAFYYRPYQRDTSSKDPNQWGHKALETLHPFRARFTPKDTGTYVCWFSLETKLSPIAISNSIRFDVVDSNKAGFMSVGENKRYFVRDSSSFFPVGQNLPWPACDPAIYPKCAETDCYNAEPWCSSTMNPAGYLAYHKQMKEYALHGGNYFRMLIAPWNLDIEFEKLNNYSDRLNCAWEMDEILREAKTNELLIHLDLHVHYPLEDVSGYSMWHWDYGDIDCFPYDDPYCYSDELGLPTVRDFLSSEEAKRHYKNRLRYFIARYGYSTNISTFELVSEVNGIGSSPGVTENCQADGSHLSMPYREDASMTRLIYLWQKEMLDFIKYDLRHEDHLLSVSVSGPADFVLGDSIYYEPSLDIATYNYYNAGIQKYFGFTEIMDDFQSDNGRSPITNLNPPAINKPLMFSEVGPGMNIEYCDSDLRFIKSVWCSAFSGVSATAMNWSNQYTPQLWSHLARIDSIMQGLRLDQENWQGVNDLSKDKMGDMMALRRGGKDKKALGLVHNRSVNFYTRRSADGTPCQTFFEENPQYFDRRYAQAQTLEAQGGKTKLEVENMGALKAYRIQWIDIETGQIISESKQNTGFNGKLTLKHPDIGVTGTGLLFFIAEQL